MNGAYSIRESQGAADSIPRTSLYLGGLPETVDENSLRAFLEGNGMQILNADFNIQVSPLSTMRERFTVLTFASPEVCKAALELLVATPFPLLDGGAKNIFVSYYIPDFKARRMSASGSVVVKGLPMDITEDVLKGAFSGYGEILSVRLTDGSTAHGRTAFINYASEQMAQAAIQGANGLRLGSSTVAVEKMVSPEERRKKDFRVYLTDVPAEYATRPKLLDVLSRYVGPGCVVTDDREACPITFRSRWNQAKGIQTVSAMFNCTSAQAMETLINKVNVHEILGMHAQRWVDFREASRRRTLPSAGAQAQFIPGAGVVPPALPPALAIDGLKDDVNDEDLLVFCRSFGPLQTLGVAEGNGCKIGYVQYSEAESVAKFKLVAVAQEKIFGKRLAKDEQAGIRIGYASLH